MYPPLTVLVYTVSGDKPVKRRGSIRSNAESNGSSLVTVIQLTEN